MLQTIPYLRICVDLSTSLVLLPVTRCSPCFLELFSVYAHIPSLPDVCVYCIYRRHQLVSLRVVGSQSADHPNSSSVRDLGGL
ncbi:hypothetical protein GGS23DRAFT_552091 [Durotheca rogersii]|uniref:uncharacterized protein n=1 Tax=Durotheca rogersii TaxID=419775 RepID=UPI00221EC88D|nr:uncharacterized protein GGS23DRAFT_552091 [Durotheca rogersii]KAI5866791.1 hypothetical protein GGS23DRAFT_552091 [Durotheca rogersii]